MPWRAVALAGVAETCFSPEMSPWEGAGSLETTTAPESEVPWVSRSAGSVHRKPGSFLTSASPQVLLRHVDLLMIGWFQSHPSRPSDPTSPSKSRHTDRSTYEFCWQLRFLPLLTYIHLLWHRVLGVLTKHTYL